MAERDAYWMHIIDTNPTRVVALFHSIWARNRFAPRSRFGDGPEVGLHHLGLCIGGNTFLSYQPLSDTISMTELCYRGRYGTRGGR